jgi:hypothetical protein
MYYPIDTGPFKLVSLRPTDSIKAHPQSRYSKPGRAYPTASAALDPKPPLSLRAGNGSSCPIPVIRARTEDRRV